jgi:hypothetical protein
MIDLFEVIKDNNLIGIYSMEDLMELLNNNRTDNYSIQLVSKNRIIIKDNNTNTLNKLECVCNYFNIDETDCNDIKESLLDTPSCCNCKDCFKACIKKLQEGAITKK